MEKYIFLIVKFNHNIVINTQHKTLDGDRPPISCLISINPSNVMQ